MREGGGSEAGDPENLVLIETAIVKCSEPVAQTKGPASSTRFETVVEQRMRFTRDFPWGATKVATGPDGARPIRHTVSKCY